MYKRIGIIGAMEDEVEKLYELMENKSTEKVNRWKLHIGKLSGKDVVIARSGVGKVNMAACTQMLIDRYNVDFVLNTGIAGSLDASLNIGDIVVSSECIQHDMDATHWGYANGVIPQLDCSVFKADEKAVELALSVCAEVNPDIRATKGRVLSGDVFVADTATKDWLVNTFNGLCTEMEGAAMAQVAYINNIPFLVLRVMSDKADGSAKMDNKVFEIETIKHTVGIVRKLMEVM